MQTTQEAVAFFETWLFTDAAAQRIAELAGLTTGEAAAALPRHLGLCFDVCHAAVEFEDVADSIAALRAAGLPIHKMQLSAALRLPRADAAARAALEVYDEPTYLHQVTARAADGGLTRCEDLPEALARAANGDAALDGAEWRVHFHVPVFAEAAGALRTTREALETALALHRQAAVAPHLEIETYTWDVLPPDMRANGVEAAVARELRWAHARLTS
jgi:hypothetical protein